MYNITTEQILKTKAPKQAAVFKTVMILACILAVTTIPSTYALGILLTAVLVVFTVILFKYYNAEYEYSLVDGELTIDKIMSQSMRKRCGVYNIAKAARQRLEWNTKNCGPQNTLPIQHPKRRLFYIQWMQAMKWCASS